jgi:hypothetical protein
LQGLIFLSKLNPVSVGQANNQQTHPGAPMTKALQTYTQTHARRRLLLALGAMPLLAASLSACASDMRYLPAPGPVQLQVVDRASGQPLTVYEQGARRFVAGTPGARYALRVSNHTASRVLVVLAVDGVNVLTGQTAGSGQTGYVLDPGSSHDITGWRKSDSAVAAFEFAALSDSYAARTGRPGNVGVIGMAAFFEKPEQPQQFSKQMAPMAAQSMGAAESSSTAATPPPGAPAPASAQDADRSDSAPQRRRADAVAPSAALAAKSSDKLGTAHGQREYSVVTRTSFERQSNRPNWVMEVAYDSRANLIATGVIPAPVRQARAFPLDPQQGFVPDPPQR